MEKARCPKTPRTMLDDSLVESVQVIPTARTHRNTGAPGSGLSAQLLVLQRRFGNAAVTQLLKTPTVQTDSTKTVPRYAPKVTRTPAKLARGLNEWAEVDARVTNAGTATRGTEFHWDWDWDTDDSKVLAPDDRRPAAGPGARLRAKTTAVGETFVDPIVDYTLPGGNSADLPSRSTHADPVQVTVPAPKAAFNVILTHGGQAAGVVRREGICYMGDEIHVSATLSGVRLPQYLGLNLGVRGSSPRFAESVQWRGDRVTWTLKATQVGKSRLEFWVQVPGASQQLTHVEDMSTLLDLTRFHLAVSSAQSAAQVKLGRAVARINDAAASYERAYDLQQEILMQKAKEDQIEQDLAMGVLFAMLGGAAGGAVGGLLKKSMGDAAKKVGGEAVTDMGKDLIKYGVRTLPKLVSGDSGGQSGGTTDTPPGRPGISDKGENQAAGEKPSRLLYRLSANVGGDQAKIHSALQAVLDLALKRSAEGNFAGEFDEDPREYVERDVTVDQIADAMVVDDMAYFRQLWHAWLPGNIKSGLAYTATVACYYPKGWLVDAAKLCGEDAKDWMLKYLGSNC